MEVDSSILIKEEYYPNSKQLKYRIGYKNGKTYGPAFGWYEDGNPQYIGFWEYGEPHSVWTHFDKSGIPSYEYRYYGKKLPFKAEHADLMHAFLTNIGYTQVTADQVPCSLNKNIPT
jgi:antitoxin component YwqK of YwqJK toxin-antitoxin module